MIEILKFISEIKIELTGWFAVGSTLMVISSVINIIVLIIRKVLDE